MGGISNERTSHSVDDPVEPDSADRLSACASERRAFFFLALTGPTCLASQRASRSSARWRVLLRGHAGLT